jgi:RNA polymerase sigma factor (sigma-70 family)
MNKFLPNQPSSQEEAEIWRSFKNSSELAFSLIFTKHYSDLFTYGLKVAGEEELVKDTIQDLMVTLWSSRERLGDVTCIKFYLLKSLRRNILKALQKKKGWLELTLFLDPEPDIVFSPEEVFMEQEAQLEQDQYFSTLLNDLPKRQKEAVYLKYYANLEFDEVAEVMGLNYQSVVNHIHRAFQVLRKNKAFADWYQGKETVTI